MTSRNQGLFPNDKGGRGEEPGNEVENGKLKQHILPFSRSCLHVPVHSSLIPAHCIIFRWQPRSQGFSPPRRGRAGKDPGIGRSRD